MIVTGAFLAEAAATVDNKLHVWGGVLETVDVGPDRFARLVLVVLTQAESPDPGRELVLEVIPPSGDDRLQIPFELPEAVLGGEIGFAFFPIEMGLPSNGRYVFLVTGGGATISLPL